MKHEIGTYFAENGDPTVPGFTIIEHGDGQYRIAEKWKRGDGPDTWVTYWIDTAVLAERTRQGTCTEKGTVSDEQFEAICQKTDKRALA